MTPNTTEEARSQPVSPVVLFGVVACAALSIAAWWPGMMSYDSISAWRMTENGQYTNAHPVLYILIIAALRHVADTPASVLVFNVVVFSIGSLFLAEALRRRCRVVGWLVPLTLLLPFITNFIGILWKDTAMAACWWAAAGLGIYCREFGQSLPPRVRMLLVACAGIFFVVGLAIRHNALIAAPFLLVALILCMRPAPRGWLRRLGLLCVAGVLSIASTTLTNTVIDQFVEVRKINMINDLFLFDLAGISKHGHVNAFPVEFDEARMQKALNCYRPTDWNSYAHPDLCLFVMDELTLQGWYENNGLARHWLRSVTEYPRAYLQHRLTVFASLLRIDQEKSYGARYAGIDPNEFGLVHPEHAAYRHIQEYVTHYENSVIMKPWFWLAGNVMVIVILLVATPGRSAANHAVLVAGSGLVYLLCYLPFGIASDFRYAYWTIFSTLFAWWVLACCASQSLVAHVRKQTETPR